MVYTQVPIDDEEADNIELSELSPPEDFNDDEESIGDSSINPPRQGGESRLPDLAFLEEQLLWGTWNRWEEPCLLSVGVTIFLVLPLLFGWIAFAYNFTGRLWCIWIFVLHAQFRMAGAVWYIKSTTTVSFQHRTLLRVVCSMLTMLELALCALVYPSVASGMMENLFTDVDGTWVYDWTSKVRILQILKAMGWLVVLFRAPIGLAAVVIRAVKASSPSWREWRPTFMSTETLSDPTHRQLHRTFQIGNWSIIVLNVLCILSVASHFGPWPLASLPQDCDSLDDTECSLPFPSFHHLREDPTTETGWRVNLKGLPPLRGGIPFHPSFLNELDGFSTMAPILFYMEGLKEAHEQGSDNRVKLQGPERIQYSVTQQSATLLLNVNTAKLVPHSAEIDYLDGDHPLVMVVPAEPLDHATHYALVVNRAPDVNGRLLPPTPGMQSLLKEPNSKRRNRYLNLVIPQLRKAADWMAGDTRAASLNLQDFQLIFDFVTVSATAQIGTTRAVRDTTLSHLSNSWNWEDHVTLIKEEQHSCDQMPIARTLHVQIDVPWFLQHTNSRYTLLDYSLAYSPQKLKVGKAKAIIQVPCSVQTATLDEQSGKKLRAIMEYGHGIFYHRGEIFDDYLSRLANRNGYILFAMEWRGMSAFDLPVILKTLIGNPSLFESVRDNLIQGYVNKLAFQHFCRHGLLDWLRIEGKKVPTLSADTPASVFYGNSQGAILGGGYMAVMASSGLVDRGILGVPGTPFALIMSRSEDFVGYDHLMLYNFYNNRHVRILLSLVQMGWDSVEASGLLAKPLSEPIPRVLLQAGLGDSAVPTIAAEAMARAMHGVILPNNPRSVYSVPASAAANATWDGPNVVLTELLYEKEYSSLPLDDKIVQHNRVHLCVRLDDAMTRQLEEFANTGRVIDPCVDDGCRRVRADC